MIWYIKLAIIYCVRIGIRVFYLFPIKKNRILFCVFGGKFYGCSAKYIFEYLYNKYGTDIEYVWVINNKQAIPSIYNIQTVKHRSFKYIYYVVTARVVVCSHPLEPFLSKRKNQIVINTHHGGGAYKAGGFNASFCTKSEVKYMKYMRDKRAALTDYVVSSNKKFTDIFSSEKEFNVAREKFLPIGLPRNDIFFLPDSQHRYKEKICNYYGIDQNRLLILYAPTFRGNRRNINKLDTHINVLEVCHAVTERFENEAIMLFRHHSSDSAQLEGILDVSNYQDGQELLAAVDILISDYSSLIWDFSFTYRPGFLYTPDLEEYESSTKFFTPINQWQYPYALTMEDLCAHIRNYDETAAIEKIKAHHALLGSYEKGTATEQACAVIKQYLS